MRKYDDDILEAAAKITAAVAEETDLKMDENGAHTAAMFLRTLYDELAAEDDAWNAEGGTFEVYRDNAGEFRFRMKAKNGEVIAMSEGYKRKDSCLNGIACIKRYARLAKLQDSVGEV